MIFMGLITSSDLLGLLNELDEAGVAFSSATEPFDTSTSIGRMLVQLLGVFAEFERETIIDRVIKGMATKAAKGKWPGGHRPYGYYVDRDTHKLIPHPEEAPHVREIFRLYVEERLGTRAIADVLNGRGVRNRSGKPWPGPKSQDSGRESSADLPLAGSCRRASGALGAAHRLSSSYAIPPEFPPARAALQGFDLGLPVHRHVSGGTLTGRRQLRSVCRRPVLKIFDGLRAGRIVAIDGDPTLGPPEGLLEIPGLLLADRHLPVCLQEGNLAPLGHEGLPDVVHLCVMAPARLVVLAESGREYLPRPVEQGFQLRVDEVAVERISLPDEQFPKRRDSPDVVPRKVAHPAQIVGAIGAAGRQGLRQPGSHVEGRLRHGWGLKPEVGRIVTKEHAKPPRTVRAHTTPHDHTRQCDRHTALTLQGEEPRTVPPSVIARQVPDLETIHPDRDRVRVIWVVRLGNQHGAHRQAHPFLRIASATR